MSGPQLEDGFTQVAHEILDAICQFNFNGAQFRIIIKIWRLTYGYKRKDHEFAIGYLQKRTRLSASSVKNELAALIKANVLIVTKQETKTTARRLSFNKRYEQWNIPRGSGSVVQKIDLFNEDEGENPTPPHDEDEGDYSTPHEGDNPTPLSNDFSYFEGDYSTPIEIKRSLNILLKDNKDLFEVFYSTYPRKISKAAAKKAWDKLAKEKPFDPVKIIYHTMNYSETCKLLESETRFIPHPSTYLNQQRYEDYKVIDPEGLAKKKQKKKTAFERNKDLLLQEREADEGDRKGSEVPSLQSFGELPEHGDS